MGNNSFVMLLLVGVGLIILVEGRQPVKIRKCCPLNQVIDIRRMKCADSGDNLWTPWFYKDAEEPLSGSGAAVGYEIEVRIPSCPSGVGVHILPLRRIPRLNIPEVQFRVLKNGRVVGKHSNGIWIDVPDNSCIDGIMNYEGLNPYSGDETDQAIISCPVIEGRNV